MLHHIFKYKVPRFRNLTRALWSYSSNPSNELQSQLQLQNLNDKKLVYETAAPSTRKQEPINRSAKIITARGVFAVSIGMLNDIFSSILPSLRVRARSVFRRWNMGGERLPYIKVPFESFIRLLCDFMIWCNCPPLTFFHEAQKKKKNSQSQVGTER